MDQRVDNERRGDSAPRQEAKPASGAVKKKRSLFEKIRQRRGLAIAIILGAAIAILAIVMWWLHARNYESTDDAFIDTRTVQISAQVAAAIVDVPVTDNQAGRSRRRTGPAGRPRLYRAARPGEGERRQFHRANCRAAGQDRPSRQAGGAGASRADLRAAASRSLRAAGEAGRRHRRAGAAIFLEPPASQGVIRRRAGQCRRDRETGCRCSGRKLESARAQLAQAEANLSRTIITAPVAGRVTQLTAAKGALCRGRSGADDVRAARRLDHRQFQGDPARPHAPRSSPSISRSTPIRTAPSRVTSTAFKPAAAPRSACCRRKTPPAITSRSCSACRSRSSSTSRPTSCSVRACRSFRR